MANIIVTEDDIVLNNLMQKILQREGFNTEGALNGADAIHRAAENQDSLLLLDYSLPDMTGKEVIEALSRTRSQVPFVLVTGEGNEHIAVDMMKTGAMDYIIKDDGFIDKLPEKIRSVLAKLHWEKDAEEADSALQKTSYYNQVMLDGMPYISMILDTITNEIVASNAAAEKAGLVAGKKCTIHDSDSVSPCPWCHPPVPLKTGEEHQSFIEGAGKMWHTTWTAIDDNMYLFFASDISELK